MNDIFISFSSTNTDEATRICSLLEKNGRTCFVASRDIAPGQEYAARLIDELDSTKAVVLLLSKAANESPHVLREIEHAVSHKVPIIVYPLEEVSLSKSLEYFLMTHQWLTPDKGRDDKLLESVNEILNNPDYMDSMLVKSMKNDSDSEPDDSVNQIYRRYLRFAPALILLIALLFVGLFFVYLFPAIRGNNDKETLPAQTASSSVVSVKETNATTEVDYSRLGERVTFGSYNDEPIEWRIIHINEDNTAILLSSKILTVKSFDVAEGGRYNEYNDVDYWTYENHIIDDPELQILVRGNNDWSVSNIRTWLNSRDELVTYLDQAPTRGASCLGENYYSNEPGFLYGFTDEELELIIPTVNKTRGGSHSENTVNGFITSEDHVYLLSEKELSYLSDAKIPVYSKITEAAVEHETDNGARNFMDIHKVDTYYWWLRDSGLDKANEALLVLTEYEEGSSESVVIPYSVGVSYGVRPAITVDLSTIQ